MKPIQIASSVTIIFILGVTLLSGPLVPAANWVTATTNTELGAGEANVSVVEWPTKGTIEPVRFGGDEYQLSIPATKIRVHSVSGNPIVNYRLRIPAMNRSQVAVHTLTTADTGTTISLGISQSQLQSAPAEKSIDAELELLVRNQTGAQVIGSQNITIDVTRP